MAEFCRSCGARIRWAVTVRGRRMPLDIHPSKDGNIELIDGVAHVVGVSTDPADVRHISHFVTCPSAHQHRKK